MMITVAQLSVLPEHIRERIAFGPGCWQWLAGCDKDGYGKVYFNAKTSRAHRVLYTLLIGTIPNGMTLNHTCLNKSCVNPDHMSFMTFSEAGKQGSQILSAKTKARTHCPNSHPWNSENTYIDPKGHRNCRKCQRIRYDSIDPEVRRQYDRTRYRNAHPEHTVNGCRSPCWNATDDICICPCGGQNHGTGYYPFTSLKTLSDPSNLPIERVSDQQQPPKPERSDMDSYKISDERVINWADAFGNWHAKILFPEGVNQDFLAQHYTRLRAKARRTIRQQLWERTSSFNTVAPVRVVRLPVVFDYADLAQSITYAEKA